MNEYTFENLIMNPEIPGLESLIGKEVYCNDVPLACLDHANEHRGAGILREVCRESTYYPFRVEIPEEDILGFVCIVPKKEESKSKWIPFENGREFFNSYLSAESQLEKEDYFLSNHGIWLKAKDADDALFMVTEIWSCGVVFSCDMKTTEELEGEYLTINEPTTWEQLLMLYTFLDRSPCGKLAEE